MMRAVQARIAAVIASFILATLTSHGIGNLPPDARLQLESWIGHTFDLVLFLGYALIHPWLQKQLAAMESAAATGRASSAPTSTGGER